MRNREEEGRDATVVCGLVDETGLNHRRWLPGYRREVEAEDKNKKRRERKKGGGGGGGKDDAGTKGPRGGKEVVCSRT